eukprot:TRINITY_DN24925_c0_g1_i1.p1 TRINITY_DN24925_c0_g1~~TRINITY_DN24925_c0_g1_i1.p1  ORF type:complete len:101 (+),score=12.37 TRINITY_DN24925_c0_g1_i1:329-631(+)
MSKGAWGTLQKNGSQFQMKNFEIGVLFVPSQDKSPSGAAPRFVAGPTPFKYETSTVNFPLPSKVPPTSYNPKDEPWTWDIPHTEADIHGVSYNSVESGLE